MNENCLPAGLLDHLYGFDTPLINAVVNDDFGAFLGKQDCLGTTHTGSCPGYDGYLTVQFTHSSYLTNSRNSQNSFRACSSQ